MNACPGTDHLIQFLNEGLDLSQQSGIVAHVEHCSPCQGLLEELTRAHSSRLECWPPGEVPAESESTAHGSAAKESLPADPDQTTSNAGTSDGVADASPADAESDWPAVPGYEFLERLGQGGMGVVFKANQVGLNRLVALKMIRSDSRARTDHLARFRIEAEAVARLRHPNILQIYDIGEAAGLPFVALELLDGGSLDDRLGGTPQPGRQAAELAATLARAVHAAHLAGIVHRDLKPSNVLFDADGVPKVTDFGLAKRLESDSKQTESGQIMGTPSYMAPEQASGHTRDVKPAADVYALGAILYEMLTGRPPFKGETPMETVRQVIDDDPVPPSRLVPKVARDLETICLKCLNKEPHKRYESAAALADDLERYLEGKPIRGRRTPLWERALKWAKRRPLRAASLAAGAAALVALLFAWVAYDRHRLEQARLVALHTDQVQTRSEGRIDQAQEARSRNDLNDARTKLREARTMLEAEPRLTGKLRASYERAGILLAQIDSRLDEDRTWRQDHARSQEFLHKRTAALLHESQFTGLDLASSREATRRSARTALAVFADPGPVDSWRLAPLPASLSQPEQKEIKEGCYELLLILADVADEPDEGLRFLDQAARLRPATQAYHLRRADCLIRRGDRIGVEQERRAAERLEPTTAFDHFLMGKEWYKRQQWGTALQHFDRALQLQPDHFWSNCLSAICCLGLKRYPEARARLNACLQHEDENPWLYVWRGFASSQVAAQLGDSAEKLPSQGSLLRKEMELQFQAAEVDYNKAMGLLEQKPDADVLYTLLVNRGLLRFQRHDWDQSEADWRAAIQLDGRRFQAYAELAHVELRKNRPDEAVEQFGHAIALRPEQAALYRGRAEVELARREPTPAQRTRALSDLEQVIRLERPGNPVLARDHTTRARLLHGAQQDEQALAACEAALKVVPNWADAHHLRIEVLLALKRYEEVIRSCTALLEEGKPSPELYELRGLAREHLKDYAGAIEDDTKALDLRLDRASLLARRGWLYLVVDAPRLALRDSEEVLRLQPSDSDAHTGRGSALVRLGRHREAVADAEEGLRRTAPTPQRLYKAARIYAQAALLATADVRKNGQDTVTLVNRYQDRALALIAEAMKRLPADRRASFERDLLRDPALATLRHRLRSLELAGVTPR